MIGKLLCKIGEHKWQDVNKDITISKRPMFTGGFILPITPDSVRICRREHCDKAKATRTVYGSQYINGKGWESYYISKRAVMAGVKNFYEEREGYWIT